MHTSYHLFLPPDVPSVVRRSLRAGPSSTQAKRDRTRSTPYARLSDLEFRVLEPAAAGQSLDDPLPRVTFEGIRSGLAKDVAPQTPPGLPGASPTGVAEHASPAEWNASYHQGRISALQDSQQPQKASTSKPRRSIKSSRIGHSTRSIVPESSEEEDGPASDPDEMSASGSILEDWNGRMDGDETTGYGITWEAMKSGLDSGRPGLDYGERLGRCQTFATHPVRRPADKSDAAPDPTAGSHKLPTTWMSPSGAESPFDTRYESQSQSPSQSQSQTSASILPPSFSYLSRLSSLPSLATLLRLSTSLNAAPPPPRVTLLAAVLQLSEVRTVSATFGAPSRWPERFPPGKQAMCEMMVVQPEQEVGQGHKTTIIKCWGDVAVAFTEGGGDGRIQRGDVVLLSSECSSGAAGLSLAIHCL